VKPSRATALHIPPSPSLECFASSPAPSLHELMNYSDTQDAPSYCCFDLQPSDEAVMQSPNCGQLRCCVGSIVTFAGKACLCQAFVPTLPGLRACICRTQQQWVLLFIPIAAVASHVQLSIPGTRKWVEYVYVCVCAPPKQNILCCLSQQHETKVHVKQAVNHTSSR
jgi:hypothetical protein